MPQNKRRSVTALLLIVLASLSLSACNLGAYQQAQDPADPAATSPAADATSAPEPTELPAAVAGHGGDPTPVAEQAADGPPADWSAQASDELGLTIHAPEGWELRTLDAHNAELREVAGEGWLQIITLDGDNVEQLGLDYQQGMSAPDVLEMLLLAFREDGDFTVARELETYAGYPATVSDGQYQPYGERLLLGVMTAPDRAVVVIGHGPALDDEGGEATWSVLAPVYEEMLRTIEAAG